MFLSLPLHAGKTFLAKNSSPYLIEQNYVLAYCDYKKAQEGVLAFQALYKKRKRSGIVNSWGSQSSETVKYKFK